MTRAACLLAAWALLLSLLSANADAAGVCAPPVDYEPLAAAGPGDGGIGGTGRSTGDGKSGSAGGIGGTGRGGDGDEGGIGGTGIVGTITGFASICVNGLEVHYDPDVPVSENGKPASAAGLAVGQIVAVEAGRSARGLEARRIALVHALEGPVTRPLDGSGTLDVMGARVAPASAALRNEARTLRAGDWVQVSGHHAADAVLASRVARSSAGTEASVSGRADPGLRRVGGVLVDREGSGELTVRGRWNGERLIVRDSQPAAGSHWRERPAQVVLETRVRQRDGDAIRTGRRDVDALLAERRNRDRDDGWREGTLVRVTAKLDADGRLQPIRIERALHERRNGHGERTTEKGRHNDPDDRASRDALKAAERQDKTAERAERDARERAERDAKERTDRNDRNERAERRDRPERVERSGRDH